MAEYNAKHGSSYAAGVVGSSGVPVTSAVGAYDDVEGTLMQKAHELAEAKFHEQVSCQ